MSHSAEFPVKCAYVHIHFYEPFWWSAPTNAVSAPTSHFARQLPYREFTVVRAHETTLNKHDHEGSSSHNTNLHLHNRLWKNVLVTVLPSQTCTEKNVLSGEKVRDRWGFIYCSYFWNFCRSHTMAILSKSQTTAPFAKKSPKSFQRNDVGKSFMLNKSLHHANEANK